MKITMRWFILLISLSLLSGCVAYAPYPDYSVGPSYYGGYGYAAPIVPVPMYRGGWGYGGHRGYGGYWGHGGYGHHGYH